MNKIELFKIKDSWNFHYECAKIISDCAMRCSNGDVKPLVWHRHHKKEEVYIAFSSFFYGTWENSGSFIHQADCWHKNAATVVAMFDMFGMQGYIQPFVRMCEIVKSYDTQFIDDYDDKDIDEVKHITATMTKYDDYEIISKFIKDNYSDLPTLPQ